LAPSDIPRLESTAQAFPYCQILYYLIAKASSQVHPYKLSEAIPKAAVYALDRKALRNLIENNEAELVVEEKEIEASVPVKLIEQVRVTENVPITERLSVIEQTIIVENTLPVEKEQPKVESVNPRKLVPRPLSTYSSEGLARQIAMIQLEDKVFNKDHAELKIETGAIFDDQLLKEKEIAEDLIQKEKVRTTPSISMDSTPTFGTEPEKHIHQNIIERFIQSDPRIGSIRVSPNHLNESMDLSERLQASTSSDGFVTESFAILFARQGKIDKAIGVYEKLILKNPKKKDYFAQKINELRS
jgi:hypothetical protein